LQNTAFFSHKHDRILIDFRYCVIYLFAQTREAQALLFDAAAPNATLFVGLKQLFQQVGK
jgi:hypothetical protein